MFISNFIRVIRPRLLAVLMLAMATGFAAEIPADYQWASFVAPGQTLEIRLVDGNIRVEPTDGTFVEVSGWKSGSRPDPASVQIETVPHDGGLLICVVYPSAQADRPNRCSVGGLDQGLSNTENADFKVDFVVRIPAGVKFRGAGISGTMALLLKDNPAEVTLVNGVVTAETRDELKAHLVNGSIAASLGTGTGKNVLEVVNGSVEATLAPAAGVAVHGRLLIGPLTSEFPLRLRRFLVGSSLEGVLGGGEADLRMNVVSGKLALRRAPEPE